MSKRDIKAAIQSLSKLNAYHLASYAAVAGPDSLESPGADFLIGIRDAVMETLDYQLEDGTFESEDLESFISEIEGRGNDSGAYDEIADGAVPIYNHERMRTLVDLAAYHEDIEDLAGDSHDILELASYALYQVARNVTQSLIEKLAEYEPVEDAEEGVRE